jgi:hypothetical protein
MIEDNPNPADFWLAFAGEADVIENRADEHTYGHVMRRFNAMLAEHGRHIALVDE